jgi:hypothetical protein
MQHYADVAGRSWRRIRRTVTGHFTACRNTTSPATISRDATPPSTECTPFPPRPVTATHRFRNCCRGRALVATTITVGEEMITALTSERQTFASLAFNLFTPKLYLFIQLCRLIYSTCTTIKSIHPNNTLRNAICVKIRVCVWRIIQTYNYAVNANTSR